MDALIEEIKKKLNEKIDFEEEVPKFFDSGYKPFKISKSNFHKIGKTDNKARVGFIDGGNSEILGAADFSLNVVRIYTSLYKNNKKIKSKKEEFYALVYACKEDGEIFYKTKLFSENSVVLIDENDVAFNSFDASLRRGFQRINISSVSGAIRRFSELKAASQVIDELGEGDVVVLDGSLQSTLTNEPKYLGGLFKKGLEKGVIISALSKSCTLMTEKGNSLIAVLSAICPAGRWYYHPIVDINNANHQAEMAFAKFHESATHIFRIEVYKKQRDWLSNVLSLVASNSNDPVFLGYPYGLIEADRFARISNHELSYFKTMLSSKLGGYAAKLNTCLGTRDAHDILDRISY
jgi:hypothetical protein